MLSYETASVVSSIAFCLLTKLLCLLFNSLQDSMYKRNHLTSIPEKNESEEDIKVTKWVPKKKHEVLKAKYKCLKKLFQIYDASVIGILPEPGQMYDQVDYSVPGEDQSSTHSRRKKRSHRTKTDACEATTEISSGDVSLRSHSDASSNHSHHSPTVKDLKIQCSCSTQMISEKSATTEISSGDVSLRSHSDASSNHSHHSPTVKDLKIQCSCSTQMISEKSAIATTEISSGDVSLRSHSDASSNHSHHSPTVKDLKIQCSCSTQMISEKSGSKADASEFKASSMVTDRLLDNQTINSIQHSLQQQYQPMMYPYYYNEQRKPTRFQLFLQRLFGLRREKPKYMLPSGHIYAASDNNINHNYCEKWRRRGLRFRRLRKPKKTHSEIALRDLKNPAILSYVQSVQRNCLLDRTPRQCPMVGCKMMFYGIINYNDHLNMTHFGDRKYMCHYCHEGFNYEYEKYAHENEHLGFNKLNQHHPQVSATSTLRHSQRASNTQTDPELTRCDVAEEKLKKIVSFFDKIVDTENILTQLKKEREYPGYSESDLQETVQSELDSKTNVTVTDTETIASSDKRTVSCGNLNYQKKRSGSIVSDTTSKCACTPIKCHVCGEDFECRRQLSLHVELEHGTHDKFSKFHSCAGITHCHRRPSGLVRAERGKINIHSVEELRRVHTSSTLMPDSASAMSKHSEDLSVSCDPSTNIIYYESLETVKKPSMINSFVDKVRSGITNYRWEPGTKIIHV